MIEIKKMIENIENVYNQSTDREISHGKDWYKNANYFARSVSRNSEYTHKQIIFALCALSPLTPWEKNKEYLISMVGYIKLGYKPRNIPIGFYSNRIKAYRILTENNTDLLSGKKVECFADNIYKYKTSLLVTIDTWQARIAWGITNLKYNIPALTAKRYRDISLAHSILADKYHYRPLELQAITWLTYHRLLDSKYIQ